MAKSSEATPVVKDDLPIQEYLSQQKQTVDPHLAVSLVNKLCILYWDRVRNGKRRLELMEVYR